MPPSEPPPSEFERAAKEASPGLASDLWAFLKHNRKWWMVPLFLLFLLFAALAILSQTGAAPFIYSLF